MCGVLINAPNFRIQSPMVVQDVKDPLTDATGPCASAARQNWSMRSHLTCIFWLLNKQMRLLPIFLNTQFVSDSEIKSARYSTDSKGPYRLSFVVKSQNIGYKAGQNHSEERNLPNREGNIW
ncbi:hypothetical protein VNO77_02384 [Canavalia gladiata]|uniref:Uncharacterized protein n=1 Tax=Canavalia gladiata TaxID=3824 RepID=A0AAN9R5W0_CANGL